MKRTLQELAAAYDARAASFDSLDPFTDMPTHWRHVSTNVVLNSADAGPDDVALDLACGTGNVARTLGPHVKSVLGVDCSPAMLALARDGAPASCRWQLGDLRSPPRVPGLTLITCNWALHHLSPEELKDFWRRCYAALPPTGLLVVGGLFYSLPADNIDGIDGWQDPSDSYEHSAQQALEDVEALGFTGVLKALHPAVAVLWASRS